jgi:TatD DNase family protein
VAASVPLGSLLAETDAPFLTPHPHRGRRNEPAYVGYVVKKIAQIHAVADEAAEKITSSNAERLFLWQVRNNLL